MDNNINPELFKTLAKLKDIHYPNDSLWWPPAPGKAAASGFAIFAAIAILTFIFKTLIIYYKSRNKKLALSELNDINNNFNSNKNIITTVQNINILLKKCAITKYNKKHKNISSLSGKEWINFLDNTSNNKIIKSKKFNSISHDLILKAPYLSENKYTDSNNKQSQDLDLELELKKLINVSKKWIINNL